MSMGRNINRETTFRFKEFSVSNNRSAMKIGTDSVLLGAWADVTGTQSALDVGCGTGILSLMLAQRGVNHITGIEIDPTAAEEASENAERSPWKGTIEIKCGDCTTMGCDRKFDLIISNPPYFNSELRSPEATRATARHEASLNFASLMRLSSTSLTPSGRLAFIAPADRADDIMWEATLQRLHLLRRCDVVTSQRRGASRTLWEFSAAPCVPSTSSLILRNPDGTPTKEYQKLTEAFYL